MNIAAPYRVLSTGIFLLALNALSFAQTRIELISGDLSGAKIEGLALHADSTKSVLKLVGREVPLRDVLQIDFQRRPQVPSTMEIELTDGSRLVGDLTDSKNPDALRLVNSLFEQGLEVPIEFLRQIRRLEPAKTRRPYDHSSKTINDGDVVTTREGATLKGVLTAIDAKGIQFEDETLGELAYSWPQLTTVEIAALDEAPKIKGPQLKIEVTTASGGRLLGSLLELNSQHLKMTTALFGTQQLPTKQLNSIRLLQGRVAYLSDRDPSKVVEGNDWIRPEIFKQFFSWQRDRSVDRRGRPLQIGKRIFEKGLGVHSRSELTFEVLPGDLRLQSWIGIDATGRPQQDHPDFGSVVFVVKVDAIEKFNSGDLNWQSEMQRINIDISKAKSFTLIVELGKGHHVLDRANWADARVVRQ